MPGLDPQPPGDRRARLVPGQRAGDDPLQLVPRIAQRGDVGFQHGDLGVGGVPEGRHQQVLARAEVVLQGADRDAALGRHVGEAGSVRAALGDDPAGRLQDCGLTPARPAAGAAGGVRVGGLRRRGVLAAR
jgi:hypothetical protein